LCIESEQICPTHNAQYLGYNLTYKGEIDIEEELEKFNRALRVIKQAVRPEKDLKHKRLGACKATARNGLSGSKNKDSSQPKWNL
jgi:hypothetical protein